MIGRFAPLYPFPDSVAHGHVFNGDTRLHLAGTTPNEASHGLFLVPGYTDHMGRYGDFFDYFERLGYGVWAMDPRGHGLSAGRRGYVARFDHYLDDLQTALAAARERSGIKSWTLLGHSTGGLMVISALVRRQAILRRWGVKNVVLTSPLLAIRLQVPPARRRLAEFASSVLPWLSLPSGSPQYANSHDPEQEARRRSDPLIFKWANARWFTEVNCEMDYVATRAGEVSLPVLGLQAGADRVVEPEATAAWMEGVAHGSYHVFADMYHELLLEADRPQVFAHIADWVLGGTRRTAIYPP